MKWFTKLITAFILALLAMAAVSIFMARSAQSQQQMRCMAHSLMLDFLADNYGESPQVRGLSVNNRLFEVYASQTGTWSIVGTDERNIACIIAWGESYDAVGGPTPGVTPEPEGDPT